MAKKVQQLPASRQSVSVAVATNDGVGKSVAAAVGGAALTQTAGVLAAQISPRWGGTLAASASTVLAGIVGFAASRGQVTRAKTSFAAGAVGGALLNVLRAVVGMSKNHALRDMASLQRVYVQAASPEDTASTSPAATDQATSPAATDQATSPAATDQATSPAAAPSTTTKSVEVKAIAKGDQVQFMKTHNSERIPYARIHIREDGWIYEGEEGKPEALLVDRERIGWMAEGDPALAILKGHAEGNIQFLDDEAKGRTEGFSFFDDENDTYELAGLVALDGGVNGLVALDGGVDGLVDLDGGVNGLVDLDGGVNGLVDIDDDGIAGSIGGLIDLDEFDEMGGLIELD